MPAHAGARVAREDSRPLHKLTREDLHSLEDYADLVSPDLSNRVKVSEKQVKIHGQPALRTEWQGRTEGIDFVFFFTIVQRQQQFFQVVSWTVKGNDDTETRAAVKQIATSLRFFSDTQKAANAEKD